VAHRTANPSDRGRTQTPSNHMSSRKTTIPLPTRAEHFVLAGLLVLSGSCSRAGEGASDALMRTVTASDLHITVRERAELQAKTDTRVLSKLEGRNTLIYLIPEGTVARKGDKLAELDASLIEEKRATQAVIVTKADAMVKQARKNFEVMEKELLAADRTAASRLQIANIRVAKFLGQVKAKRSQGDNGEAGTNHAIVRGLRKLIQSEGLEQLIADPNPAELIELMADLLTVEKASSLEMGGMANLVMTQIDEVELARADFELARDTLLHSERLAQKGFVTINELARDRINHNRQSSRVSIAWNNLKLLIKFTLHESLIELKQEADNSQLGLESIRAGNEAKRVKQSAELISAEAEYTLAKERLDKWDEQIAHAILIAPAGGLVVYGREDWDEPVYEGMEVRQRQDIVILPDIRTMVARIKVHEAQVDKVAIGQPADIKIDAFPGQIFKGHVSKVSTLPDPSWRSNPIKVYSVTVLVDRDNSTGQIRPGMNGTVEIEVGVLPNVVNVPLPALDRSDDQHFIWKATPDGPVATPVKLGSNNLTHVEILSGVQRGDRIHLARPTGMRLPQSDVSPKPAKGDTVDGSESGGNQAAPPTIGG
jgi:RND family efflux transporter MFP subunit